MVKHEPSNHALRKHHDAFRTQLRQCYSLAAVSTSNHPPKHRSARQLCSPANQIYESMRHPFVFALMPVQKHAHAEYLRPLAQHRIRIQPTTSYMFANRAMSRYWYPKCRSRSRSNREVSLSSPCTLLSYRVEDSYKMAIASLLTRYLHPHPHQPCFWHYSIPRFHIFYLNLNPTEKPRSYNQISKLKTS